MNHPAPPNTAYQYQSFLIRLWQDGEESPWRGSAKHVATGEQLFFDNLDSLFVYLSRRTETAVNSNPIPISNCNK